MRIQRTIVSIVTAGLLWSPLAVLAQTTSPSPSVSPSPKPSLMKELRDKMKDVKNEMKDKRQEFKTEMKDLKDKNKEIRKDIKDELKEKRDERHKERLRKLWRHMVHRLEKLIRNEKRLAERIAKRLDRAAANGKDVTELRNKLTAAKDLIMQAENALKDATAKVEEILNGTGTSQEKAKQIKELQKGVLEKIKAAHQALVEVVKGLKGLGSVSPSPSVSVSPSTSPSSTPSPTPTPSVS